MEFNALDRTSRKKELQGLFEKDPTAFLNRPFAFTYWEHGGEPGTESDTLDVTVTSGVYQAHYIQKRFQGGSQPFKVDRFESSVPREHLESILHQVFKSGLFETSYPAEKNPAIADVLKETWKLDSGPTHLEATFFHQFPNDLKALRATCADLINDLKEHSDALPFLEAKQELAQGQSFQVKGEYKAAIAAYRNGIQTLGNRYSSPDLLDDSGMKLVLARSSEEEGDVKTATTMYGRVLESRIHLYAEKFASLVSPLSGKHRLNQEFITEMLGLFRSSHPTIGELARLTGATENPMPPNQVELLTPKIDGLERAEVVLNGDNDSRVPIQMANLILSASSTLSLGEAEATLGRSHPVDEDRPAAPAQMVSFARISVDYGPEIMISARVERPAGKSSLIRSLQFVRSYTEKRLSLAKFKQIKLGMSLDQIYQLVGRPIKDVGSGLSVLQYTLDDASSVLLSYGGPQLIKITHITKEGKRDAIEVSAVDQAGQQGNIKLDWVSDQIAMDAQGAHLTFQAGHKGLIPRNSPDYAYWLKLAQTSLAKSCPIGVFIEADGKIKILYFAFADHVIGINDHDPVTSIRFLGHDGIFHLRRSHPRYREILGILDKARKSNTGVWFVSRASLDIEDVLLEENARPNPNMRLAYPSNSATDAADYYSQIERAYIARGMEAGAARQVVDALKKTWAPLSENQRKQYAQKTLQELTHPGNIQEIKSDSKTADDTQ